jgi:pimeloyl-ACP methyl ester carboxylesterase
MQDPVRPFRLHPQGLDSFGCRQYLELNFPAMSLCWAPPGAMKYLVVQGTNDQIAPPENGKLLKEELEARVTLISFPGAGHLLIVTEHGKAARRSLIFS